MQERKVFMVFLVVICGGYVAAGDTDVLTNAYAKVAKWGTSLTKNVEEGRSNNGQTLFTQSSDVELRSGQNLRDQEKVVYHYSVPGQRITSNTGSKKLNGFQDRFNPPPAFQFGDSGKRNVPDGRDHDHEQDQHEHENVGPVYVPPKVASYDSPISSYSPAASGLPDSDTFVGGTKYPPFNPSSASPNPSQVSGSSSQGSQGFQGSQGSSGSSNYPFKTGSSDMDSSDYGDSDGYHYDPPSSGYLGPSSGSPSPILPTPVPSSKPLPSLPITNQYKFPPYVYDPPSDYDDQSGHQHQDYNHQNGQNQDHDHSHNHDYHYDHDHQQDHHQDDEPHQDQHQPASPDQSQNPDPSGPPSNPSAQDYPDYPQVHDHHHHNHDHNHHQHSLGDLPEYLDHDPGHESKFNNFPLWSNFYDDDHAHPVYQPVITTTPKPPPPKMEDENRVNKGHYSYYYLGRKLYYIPLYFSVYFIIYITVLILKSIARHKVNFVHELDNVNKGRSLSVAADQGGVNSSVVDEVEENTTRAIMQFKRRFIAM